MKVHPPTRTAAGRGVSDSRGAKAISMATTALAAALLFGAGGANATPAQRSSEGPWAKSRVLVMPKPGLSETELGKIVGAHGGKARKITSSGLYMVELPGNASETAVAARLANNPHLKFAEVDRLVPSEASANDPFFGSQWHLPKIGVPQAWDLAQGSGVTIAILDSGVDSLHADLAARLVPGWNFEEGNSNTADVYGHGTKVAGTAAATLNNATGVASVAGQARIMPIRVTDTSGWASISGIAQGLTYAADRGARVANVSFSVWDSPSVQSAAQYMKNRNGLVFISAGNSNAASTVAPSSAWIVVAATTSTDAKASFSNYGNYVHLAAPGSSIYSTVRGGGYGSVSGTSFAAPVSAGVAALVMSANPRLSSAQVEGILFNTAVDLGTAGKDPIFGNGRVNAAAAVQAALNSTVVSTSDTLAPSVAIGSPVGSSTVSGQVPVVIEASDNVGVTKVELRVGGKVVATDTTAPFGFSWDSTTTANGMATLEARAYDDAGNSSLSSPVAVNVANVTVTAADTVAPSVAIANPANGSTVSGTVSVQVNAADNSGVSGLRIALSIDGAQVATATGSSSLRYSWNTRKLKAGSYTLRAVATDAAGNVQASEVSVRR